MERTRCFFLSGVPQWKISLRRYDVTDASCRGPMSYHTASRLIGIFDTPEIPEPAKDDPQWPKECPCGYAFLPSDRYIVDSEQLFRRMDTGALITLEEAPPGAMWHADWMLTDIDQSKMGNMWRGLDGHCLVVRLPNKTDWLVDSRGSNCSMPTDNIHKCWPRHGEVPNITVDKNGNTCAAGAGSIWSRAGMPNDWHGFLRNGWLERC